MDGTQNVKCIQIWIIIFVQFINQNEEMFKNTIFDQNIVVYTLVASHP